MGTQWDPNGDQLLCRDIQHQWTVTNAKTVERNRMFLYERTMMCQRCWTFKIQYLNDSGYILYTRMTYPDRYLRKNEGRFTKEDRAALRMKNMEGLIDNA